MDGGYSPDQKVGGGQSLDPDQEVDGGYSQDQEVAGGWIQASAGPVLLRSGSACAPAP